MLLSLVVGVKGDLCLFKGRPVFTFTVTSALSLSHNKAIMCFSAHEWTFLLLLLMKLQVDRQTSQQHSPPLLLSTLTSGFDTEVTWISPQNQVEIIR